MNIRRTFRGVATLAAVINLVGHTGVGADYLGASAVLQQAAERAGEESAKPVGDDSAAGKLNADIEAYLNAAVTQSPSDAAVGWLALAERALALRPADFGPDMRSMRVSPVEKLMTALPPPPAWGALIAAIDGRPAGEGDRAAAELGLHLVAAALLADSARQEKIAEQLEEMLREASRNELHQLGRVVLELNQLLASRSDSPDQVLKLLERQLRRSGDASRHVQTLRVPDLVTIAGPEKAEEFLRRALTTGSAEIEVQGGVATAKLAQRLALELIAGLKAPQWRLAATLDGGKLYEALEAKFTTTPAKDEEDPLALLERSGHDYGREQARAYYLLSLIIENRQEAAVNLAREQSRAGRFHLPREALRRLEAAGHADALHVFFRQLLTTTFELPFWSSFLELGARTGRSEEVIALLETTLARAEVPEPMRLELRQHHARALLAADRVEEAITAMRALMAENNADPETTENFSLQLARLGQILERPELVEEGLRAGMARLRSSAGQKFDYFAGTLRSGLVELLIELDRGPEAEALLLEELATQLRQQRGQSHWRGMGEGSVDILVELAAVYSRAGRHADVLLLLDEAEGWGTGDLLELLGKSVGGYYLEHHGAGSETMGSLAARALLRTGRANEAQPVIAALLNEQPGNDRAYELLLEFNPTDIEARLDELFARDRFEERPLIWKAVLLKRAGRPADAEKLLRQAIAIDPSDGEQGPGDRMRVYAELADVRVAQGAQGEADFLRGAVRAIRLSEQADQLHGVGLIKRALTMYQQSLTHFADAYCIQSRLALRFAEWGMMEQAETHYLRAFELMPDSFGRVESHCFGCEGAFQGNVAQGVAERVFQRLAREKPDKPQVHYLLGYLRREQGRHAEALPAFREAVRLDPDYLNAWKELLNLANAVKLPQAELDQVILNQLRLDPMQRHTRIDALQVADLRALWVAVEQAATIRPPAVRRLYPLRASASQRDKALQSEGANWMEDYSPYTHGVEMVPGKVLARSGLMRNAATLIQTSMMRRMAF